MGEIYIRNIFGWDHFYVYLAGPIDFDPAGGAVWRLKWTQGLIEMGLPETHILSPTKKPLAGATFNLDNEAEIAADCRSRQDWDGIEEIIGQIAHIDLRLVDKSDLILVHFPLDKDGKRVFTVGTIHEIVVARQQRKPVYVVWEGGKETASGWLMWLVGHRNIFGTFEDLMKHLKSVADGKAAYNAKDWLLLDFDKTVKERDGVNWHK